MNCLYCDHPLRSGAEAFHLMEKCPCAPCLADGIYLAYQRAIAQCPVCYWPLTQIMSMLDKREPVDLMQDHFERHGGYWKHVVGV